MWCSARIARRAVPCLVALALAAPAGSLRAQGIGEDAARQIAALLQEKAGRTRAERKIDSRLLYALKSRRGDPLLAAVPRLRTGVEIAADGTILVDIRTAVDEPILVYIDELGGTVVGTVERYDHVRARLPLAQLETLAARDEVRFIGPAEIPVTRKNNTSEGDVAHRADQARSLGFTGSGLSVGVLSDGVDSLAALQASGDLPAVVTVLPGQSGVPGTSEGTAMLEIVFDLAPGAALSFATAFGGQAQFATNIADLAASGAAILVDDVFYFAEPPFQDGIVAQAVNDFTASGGFYFSSAGNSGNLNDGTSGVWEGDFVSGSPPAGLLPSDDTHDFGGSSVNVIAADPPFFVTLHWSDPQGASANDYDLCILNGTGSVLLGCSMNVQDGNDDPYEAIDSRSVDDVGNSLAIIRNAGAAGRCLHLNTHRGQLGTTTAGQTAGHATAADGFGIAAVNATNPGGVFVGGATNPVETFSSDGPRRVILDPAGNPLTPNDYSCAGGVLRQKPDFAAADGVTTATPGFAPFFGTSAAAPHAAAIAALVEQAADLTPSGMRQVLTQSSLDIEAAGPDRDSGAGILDALPALRTVAPSAPCAVNDLVLSGTPNRGPTTFRACTSITWQEGTFDDVTGKAPLHMLADGAQAGGTSSWGD